jgi:phosphoribosyl 1,2-cyclic phosphodiesterase
LRFASLGSGSRGNATLVESGSTCLMVDCGFSRAEAEKRLARLDRAPGDITAILVTHEHADHIGGVGRLARKYDIPVWATSGTLAADADMSGARINAFNCHRPLVIGDLCIEPFPVPHDAREPCQFVFDDGSRLGLLTDIGSPTPHVARSLEALDALILEFNHDPQMLATGPYPPGLKRRVGGDFGHLNNAQAATLLDRIDRSRLRRLIAAHISEKNNHPELVREALDGVLGGATCDVEIACQDEGFAWVSLSVDGDVLLRPGVEPVGIPNSRG